MDQSLIVNFAVAMTAIVNPVGKVPLWITCIQGQSRAADWRTASLIIAAAAAILFGFLWGGTSLLALFSIDLASFRVAGSFIVLHTGWSMLQGRAADIDADDEEEQDDPMDQAKSRFRQILVPMAIPILAGPGSITTVIVFTEQASGAVDRAWLSGVLALVLLATFGVLIVAPMIHRVIGEIGLTVITRLAGLLIIAIAVQLMLSGLAEVFPNWLDASSPLTDDVTSSATSASDRPGARTGP